MSASAFEYSAAVDGLPRWQHVALIAASAARLQPVYDLLSDADEQARYANVLDTLWRASEEDGDLDAAHSLVLALWPEEEDEMDVLTPYHWKIATLRLLKISLESAVTEGAESGARWALDLEIEITSEYEGGIYFAEVPAAAPPGLEAEVAPFEEYARGNIRKTLGALASATGRAQGIQRVRGVSSDAAHVLKTRLVPPWIQSNGWSPEDLDSARGAAQMGR
jgi:hypothetical protein